MGKLYLASFQYKANDGVLVNDQRLIHADIKNGMNEHAKALLLRDWAEQWFKETYSGVELTGCKVNTTLDWVAPKEKVSSDGDEEPKSGHLRKFDFDFTYTPSQVDRPYSVFFEDQESGDIVVAGYGTSFEEALYDLQINLMKDRPQITI